MNTVFSLPLEGWSMQRAIDHLLRSSKPVWMVTANPEIMLEVRRDPAYAQAIAQADMRLVDGFGLWCALRLQGEHPTRVTGVDFAEELIRVAMRESWKVVMLGGVSTHAAADAIRCKYPGATIVSEEAGSVAGDGSVDERTEEAMSRITMHAPDVLLVGFGHPKQERWIAHHAHDFPSVKVFVGVGGTFDVWAGVIPRAPEWLRSAGLEWLWRVTHEPRRIGRIFRAVVVFPLRWFIAKFPFFR